MTIFYPCLLFALITLIKCAILPPAEATRTRLVFGLYARCSNEDTPPRPAVKVASDWGWRPRDPPAEPSTTENL